MPTIAELNAKYANAPITTRQPDKPGFWGTVGNEIAQSFGAEPASGVPKGLAGSIPNPVKIVQGLVAPVTKGLATGVRSLQATPQVLTGDIAGANKTMAEPLFGAPTLGGSSATQNLGTAAQAASFLVPATGLGNVAQGAVAGGLQAGGQALQEPNTTAGQTLENTALGAVFGAGTSYAMPKITSLITDHPIFQSSPSTPFDMTKTTGGIMGKLSGQTGLANAEASAVPVANEAVGAVGKIKAGLSTGQDALGASFRNAGQQIKAVDPNLVMNLTQDELTALNGLKEGKNFDLPDYLNQDNIPTAMVGGKSLDLSQMNPNIASQIQEQLGQMGGKKAVSLDPIQTQDLLARLGRSTYKEVGGRLQVDQQRIEILNQLKDKAQSTFGHITGEEGQSVWNKAYQDYAQGMQARKNFESLLSLKPNTSPDKILSRIQDLQKTAQGRIILQNTIDDLKNSPFEADFGEQFKKIDNLNQAEEVVQNALDRIKQIKSYKKTAAWMMTGGLAGYFVRRFLFDELRKTLEGK